MKNFSLKTQSLSVKTNKLLHFDRQLSCGNIMTEREKKIKNSPNFFAQNLFEMNKCYYHINRDPAFKACKKKA